MDKIIKLIGLTVILVSCTPNKKDTEDAYEDYTLLYKDKDLLTEVDLKKGELKVPNIPLGGYKSYNLNFSESEREKLEIIFYKYGLNTLDYNHDYDVIDWTITMPSYCNSELRIGKRNKKNIEILYYVNEDSEENVFIRKNKIFLYRKKMSELLNTNKVYKRVVDSMKIERNKG